MREVVNLSSEQLPTSVDDLARNPQENRDLLLSALIISRWENPIQLTGNDEMRAVTNLCSQYDNFIELAFDELYSNSTQESIYTVLWGQIQGIEFSGMALNSLGFRSADIPYLQKQQKERQFMVAFAYQLDKLAQVNEANEGLSLDQEMTA